MSDLHPIEIWKQIPDYGLHYEASSLGRIRVKDRSITRKHPTTGRLTTFNYKGKVLSPAKADKWGHLSVTLGVDGVDYSVSVHKLVLLAFVGEKKDGMEACHRNGNAGDNRPENLRWDTHYSNNQDRKMHGRYPTGERHPMAKLTQKEVSEIRASGLTGSQVAQRYGISKSTAHRILTGRTWQGNV